MVEVCPSEPELAPHKSLTISAIGPDRPGIVREISQALSTRNINVDYLDTNCSNAPWSGEPQFEAKCSIRVPVEFDIEELEDQLDTIANELTLDIQMDSETGDPEKSWAWGLLKAFTQETDLELKKQA